MLKDFYHHLYKLIHQNVFLLKKATLRVKLYYKKNNILKNISRFIEGKLLELGAKIK